MNALQFKIEDHSQSFDKSDVWADDCLRNRDDAARRLNQIVSGQEQPLTICLNGEWGSGKTYFLTRFVENYNSGTPVGRAVYFNAWEDDFLENPLLAIVSQLKKVAPDEIAIKLLESVRRAALPCFTKIGLSIAKQFVKNKLGVDAESVEVDDLRTDLESVYRQYDELCLSRETLRTQLKNFAEEVWTKTGKPLLFVVDELDRCRPTFAIELLERIKHLFCVPHMVFIIGADVGQLEKSIKAVYGDIDSHDYLHRFFDVEFRLPQADKGEFVHWLWESHQLESSLRSRGVSLGSQRAFINIFERLIKYRNISLRQIEQCVRTFAFLAMSNNNSSCDWSLLAAVAVVLKVTDRPTYLRFVRMEYVLGELIDYLFGGLSYKEIDGDEEVYRLVQHLNKVAFYCSDTDMMHRRLGTVHNTMIRNGEIQFDGQVMPQCFQECSQADLKAFYGQVFNEQERVMYTYRCVPGMLKRLDEGIRFLCV